MSTLERPIEQPDLPPNTRQWLAIIKERWEDIPEFDVSGRNFNHLAVICDGNRRFAVNRGLETQEGHVLGVEVIKGIADAARLWGVKHLTFWTWSTENWKRDREQVGFVMGLAAVRLRDQEFVDKLRKHETKFTHFGRKDRLPEPVRLAIEDLEALTAGYDRLFINLALDYGGPDEFARAIVDVVEAIELGKIRAVDITSDPDLIANYLDSRGQPFPDLVIRTGVGENEISHTSGFMPLQTAYSGWAFTPNLFPDLTPDTLMNTIENFLDYEMRKGT